MVSIRGTTCVVIPFYQHAGDSLVRAVNSILAQQDVIPAEILIVDDGSPFPARKALEPFFVCPGMENRISIINQENGGAAKARNIGLSHVKDRIEFVAFLDSDDVWTPNHLSNAQKVLDSGCDFYFANYQRDDWPVDRFTQMGESFEIHPRIDQVRKLFIYDGDIIAQVMGQQLVKTSSVVFRREGLSDIRFPEDLVVGEDDVFWLKAMRRVACSGFSGEVEVRMGSGVNISQGGAWGSDRAMQLMALNMRKWRRIPALFPAEKELDQLARGHVKELRRLFVASVLHRMRRGKWIPAKILASFTAADWIWPVGLSDLVRSFVKI